MKWTACVFIFLSLGAQSATTLDQPKNYGRYFISGTPSEKTLREFKEAKGAEIVDLRAMDELGNCSEPATATKVGLQYGRVEFAKKPEIPAQVIADIDAAVKKSGDKPVLLFCKTGNRAAAWLAVHLIRDEKMSIDEAIKITRPMGLKKDMEAAVRKFVKAQRIDRT